MKQKPWLFILLALSLISCQQTEADLKQFQFRGQVFGTYYSLIYYHSSEVVSQESVDSLFAVFNASLSYYDKQSLISRINRNETRQADDFFRVVFARARQISEETDGAYDVTVTPLVNAWGFGFSERERVTQELLDSIREFVGFRKAWMEEDVVMKSDPRVQFDFNSIAKGYAADVVGAFLESRGIVAYMIEIGGDLLARGLKPGEIPWKIGLERPASSAGDIQEWEYLIEITDAGLATSGNYRRYYEIDGLRYSHTINPFDGYPVQHRLLSASVVAPDAMSADAYATAFMVMGF